MAAYGFFVGEQLLERIEALTGVGPTLLVIEDLHWADPATVQLIRCSPTVSVTFRSWCSGRRKPCRAATPDA